MNFVVETVSEWDKREIECLGLPVRAYNGLKHGENINYVGELISHTERELLKIPNIGKGTVSEIKLCLARHGLSLLAKPSEAEWRGLTDSDVKRILKKLFSIKGGFSMETMVRYIEAELKWKNYG